MRIDLDFRADMTVAELVQYLSDMVEEEARHVQREFERCNSKMWDDISHLYLEYALERKESYETLIDEICLGANKCDKYMGGILPNEI